MTFMRLDDYRIVGTYIVFLRWQASPGITAMWDVRSKEDAELGIVKWHSPWRKYCFFPAASTIFEQVCLHEIAEFIESETAAHKAARKVSKA